MNIQKSPNNKTAEISRYTQIGERGRIVSKVLAVLVAAWALAIVSMHHDNVLDIIDGYIQKSTGMRQ